MLAMRKYRYRFAPKHTIDAKNYDGGPRTSAVRHDFPRIFRALSPGNGEIGETCVVMIILLQVMRRGSVTVHPKQKDGASSMTRFNSPRETQVHARTQSTSKIVARVFSAPQMLFDFMSTGTAINT